jgi:hypothetical protein
MKKIISYIFVFIAVIATLRSCVHTTINIKELQVFERELESGQIDRIVITSKNELLYFKFYKEAFEYGYYRIIGENGQKYIGGFYNVGKFPFGLRYYLNPLYVLNAELHLITKKGASFPKIGSKQRTRIIIYEAYAKFGKYNFSLLKLNDEEMKTLKPELDIFINEILADNL